MRSRSLAVTDSESVLNDDLHGHAFIAVERPHETAKDPFVQYGYIIDIIRSTFLVIVTRSFLETSDGLTLYTFCRIIQKYFEGISIVRIRVTVVARLTTKLMHNKQQRSRGDCGVHLFSVQAYSSRNNNARRRSLPLPHSLVAARLGARSLRPLALSSRLLR